MNGIVLSTAVVAIAVLLGLGIVAIGDAAVMQAQAASAADAAALAGAAAGEDAAADAARRNEAVLVSFEQTGNVVSVTVQRSNAVGVAHAERILVPIERD